MDDLEDREESEMICCCCQRLDSVLERDFNCFM